MTAMLRVMTVTRAALGLMLLVGCSAGAAAVPPSPGPGKPAVSRADVASLATPPKQAESPVVVLLVVDQLASWVFEQRRATFAADGGFERLMREGTYGPRMRYEHATTSTAPGHAALFTGLPPRESGVFANERLDQAGKPTSMFADADTKVIGLPAVEGTSSSNAVLRAETLADALRAQRPDAQIIALSLKDRASVPGGGNRPTLAAWFDAERESFVTSSALLESLPTWFERAAGGAEASAGRNLEAPRRSLARAARPDAGRASR